MDTDEILSAANKLGYVICAVNGGYAIADPLDNDEGFYVVCETLDELAAEVRDLISE